jgi:tRNA (cytidine/uridine-2'-O-)-methyltransferase
MNTNFSITNIRQIERHVVLVAPEIHWNTGNIGRTCLSTGAVLHLIQPLGFSLDSREVKRAGLDYWNDVNPCVWEDFEAFHAQMNPGIAEVAVFSKTGAKTFWSMPSPPRLFLIFGSETKGLPEAIFQRYPDSSYHIPITAKTRSLNLSTAAAIALYESLRNARPFHAWSKQ